MSDYVRALRSVRAGAPALPANGSLFQLQLRQRPLAAFSVSRTRPIFLRQNKTLARCGLNSVECFWRAGIRPLLLGASSSDAQLTLTDKKMSASVGLAIQCVGIALVALRPPRP